MEKERRRMERIEDVVARGKALMDEETKKSILAREQMEAQLERMKQLAFIRCPNDPGLVQTIYKLIEKFREGIPADQLRAAIARCEQPAH